MFPLPATRYVVALDFAGTAHRVIAAPDAATAIDRAFDEVRRADIQDGWPRRRADDFIAPHAQPYATGGSSYEVGLPILGTAYVTVEAADPTAAIARAYAEATLDDLDDWRPIRAPTDLQAPSVALEVDTEA